MGYSITQEQHERLERNRREGRQCSMSTGRGGCFTRATISVKQESWPYKIGEGKSEIHETPFCKRHANQIAESGGGNFRIISAKRI